MAPKVHPWQLIRLLGPFWGTVAVLVLIGFSVWQTGRLPDFSGGAAPKAQPRQPTVSEESASPSDAIRETTASRESTAAPASHDVYTEASTEDDGPSPPKQPTTASSAPKPTASESNSSATTAYVVRQVSIKDLDGEVVYRGDVDLTPTLERIERGERHPHRNDGGTFRNLEGRLPRKPTGYYKEYVHPTPGLDGPGPQRVVLGAEDELYYTHDHYRTFKKLR
jgi:ribonuclease T1